VTSDADLLRAWRGGDRDAGDELVARHFASILRFFRGKLGDDVEDLVQRTFLQCVESQGEIREGDFRAYLFGIARHRLLDDLRRRVRHRQVFDPEECSVADLRTSPSRHLARNQEEQLLTQALRTLPVDQQIALELAYWESMSGPEIARVLAIAENTVRSRLAQARATLRKRLEELAASPPVAESTLRTFDARAAALLAPR
jgi:RNA polymerase sigma factor (sigma-70 family)